MRGPFDVGYSAGVFDVLHGAVLRHLVHARSVCDYLIVGVLDDEAALEATGAAPLNPFAERLQIVRSLRAVDAAVGQMVNDLDRVWAQLQFTSLLLSEDDRDNAVGLGLAEGDVLTDGALVRRLPALDDAPKMLVSHRRSL